MNFTDIEPVSGAMRPLTDSLDSEQVGVSIARCEPGWRSESVGFEAGDAVRIPPTATRQIRNGDEERAFVLVSAPASQCRAAACADEPGPWPTNGFIG